MSTATATPASDLRLGQRIRYWLPAFVVLALAVMTWQWLLPDGLDVEPYLLPRFSDVVSALWNERAQLADGAWITFKEAFGGFLIGSGLAFVSALVLCTLAPVRKCSHAVHDRGERDPDHCVRAHYERMVRDAEPVVKDRDSRPFSATSPSS